MAFFQGTANVTNNSANVTNVTGFTLSPLSVFPGAMVSLNGISYILQSVTNTTSFVLNRPYFGTTATNVRLDINTISENETDIVTLNTRTADLIEDLLTFDPNNLITQFGAINGTGGNILPYISGPGSVATTTVTPYARTLLDDANAMAMQSTLGLIQGRIGAGGVPSDANLCVTPGTYYAQISSDATIANNFPTNSQGVLNVEFMLDPSNPSAPRIIQTWKSLQTPPKLFLRTIVGTSIGAWTDISPVTPSNITNSQLANIATARIKGRVSSGTGAVEDLTQAQVRTFLGFAQSTGGNGYVTLPGGVMIQWGTQPGGTDTGTTTFPITFPTLCASIVTGMAVNSEFVFSTQITAKATTGFNYRKTYAFGGGVGASVGESIYWMAIGY